MTPTNSELIVADGPNPVYRHGDIGRLVHDQSDLTVREFVGDDSQARRWICEPRTFPLTFIVPACFRNATGERDYGRTARLAEVASDNNASVIALTDASTLVKARDSFPGNTQFVDFVDFATMTAESLRDLFCNRSKLSMTEKKSNHEPATDAPNSDAPESDESYRASDQPTTGFCPDNDYEPRTDVIFRLVKKFIRQLPRVMEDHDVLGQVVTEVTGWDSGVHDAADLMKSPSFMERIQQATPDWARFEPRGSSTPAVPACVTTGKPAFIVWAYKIPDSDAGFRVAHADSTDAPVFQRALLLQTTDTDPEVTPEELISFLADVTHLVDIAIPEFWMGNASNLYDGATSDELLELLQDRDLALPLRSRVVLVAEITAFSGDQVAALVGLLRSFALENRDSDNFDTQVAVSAAVRKLVANLPPDQIGSVAELLVADHHMPVPLYVELEVTKSIVQWLLNQPCGEDESELAAGLMELAKTYINPRLLAREKHGATALNAVLGLLLLRTDSTENVIQLIERAGVAWFSDLVASRAERLCETLQQRFVGEQRETMTEHLRNAMTQLTSNTKE